MKKPIGELALIERIRQRTQGRVSQSRVPGSSPIRLGIGDDCAILRVPGGHELMVTTDFSLEGQHFRREWHTPESVGHRCIARGLSDIAAMGARPLAAFLSLALPASLAREGTDWVARFFDGLLALADAHEVSLAGGDTAQSPSDEVLADIILLGSAPTGKALLRSGAKAGDAIYVTGFLGGAAAELQALSQNPEKFAHMGSKSAADSGTHPHLYPQPRLQVGTALRQRRLATACIDISDGLSTDLAHLCAESDLCAELDATAIPVHPLAAGIFARGEDALLLALHGGEDYELLFTAPANTKMPRHIAGIPIKRIGHMLAKKRGRPQMTLSDAQGKRKPLQPHGWEHFAH